MSFGTGLLIGLNPKNVGNLLKQTFQNDTLGTLYIKLVSELRSETFHPPQNPSIRINQKVFKKMVTDCYSKFQNVEIDVRVLLSNSKDPDWLKVVTSKPIEIVYFDSSFSSSAVDAFMRNCVTNKSQNYRTVPVPANDGCDFSFTETSDNDGFALYDNVVLGGTFDKLHIGHKILLSEAVLRCCKRLTVGVMSDSLLQSKTLCELIDNCNIRIQLVKDFLLDVEPALEYDVVQINDVYGPTKTEPSFQMIVVSTETLKGALMINEYRENVGLNKLAVETIDLVDCSKESAYEETKISSSNLRMRLLGKLLRPPEPRPNLPSKPYIIGLTGGIASGKSAISNHLRTLGCGYINCDVIGHKMYEIGSVGYEFIKETFGLSVLNEDGSVNRGQLGSIVFRNQEEMSKLNRGLWPLILEKVKETISITYHDRDVVVIEAALLIQANWTDNYHEVWSCIIPFDEAVKRLQNRNNLSIEQAQQRIKAQPSNKEYVAHSNVVFCSLWDPSYTKEQVEKAWYHLKERLPQATKSTS